MIGYPVILADPPWAYRVYADSATARKSRSARAHYATMSLEAIKALPIDGMSAPDCALFLWVTSPCLPEGLAVMDAWGFVYKTVAFTWLKLTKDGRPKMGMGNYTRAETEICLLGMRGRVRRQSAGVHQAILAGQREHSRKPDEQYARIMQLFDGPYLELFARQQHPGWDVLGNETNRFEVSA